MERMLNLERMRIFLNIGGVRGRVSISKLVILHHFYFVYVKILFCDRVRKRVFVICYFDDFIFNQVWKSIP